MWHSSVGLRDDAGYTPGREQENVPDATERNKI